MAFHGGHPKIGIVGAGFSGLCAAIQLQKQLDIHDYTIFEEHEDVGGTWLVNTYPGCACDVPSHVYSFSFEPNPNWSKAYSGQEEILEYIRNLAKKHDIYPKVKFEHRIVTSIWDETISKWKVTVLDIKQNQEKTHVFDIVISGIGALRVPNIPSEFTPFSKPKMHNSEWNSSIQLSGKTVAVVGSGASAVQVIPEIVDQVKRLVVYQRHPAWVVPKMQMEYPAAAKWAFAHIPGLQWSLRNLIFWSNELHYSAFKAGSLMSKISVKYAKYHLRRQVRDPEIRAKLLPDYEFGCKRVTPSNDYYPSLAKPHVTIITSKITDVTPDSIINEDGTCEKPDVLILATGFRVQEFFAPLHIQGKGGVDLLKVWKESGPCALGGVACHHMPNAFFLLGPNTGFGHNSVIFSIECQVNWTMQVIKEMIKRNARTYCVRKSAEDKYMDMIMTKMKSTVWGTASCGSWYADHRGVITTLYPENLISYYNQVKSVNVADLDFV